MPAGPRAPDAATLLATAARSPARVRPQDGKVSLSEFMQS